MKILTIGNSFSQNSTHFLPDLCAEAGIPLTIGRCVIGGCSFERHWNNAADDTPAYGDSYNGTKTMREMLLSDEWDFVTIQQASHFSWKIGTFYPYCDDLVGFVRSLAPKAEIIVHETWAYRTDNTRLLDDYHISQETMYRLLRRNYNELAERYGSRLLPVGDAYKIMQELTGDTTGELTRKPDGPSHANNLGEFIGALIWFAILGGGDIDSVRFIPETVDPAYIPAAKEAAKRAITELAK